MTAGHKKDASTDPIEVSSVQPHPYELSGRTPTRSERPRCR